MSSTEEAPAVAESAEQASLKPPIEAELAVFMEGLGRRLVKAGRLVDQWHEEGRPTDNLPVTGRGASFAAFFRLAADREMLLGPEDVALDELREALMQVVREVYPAGGAELAVEMAPPMLAAIRDWDARETFRKTLEQCPIFGIAADWAELHVGVRARCAAVPEGEFELSDMEVYAAGELLQMAAKWAELGRPMPPTVNDADCGAWLVDHLDWLPLAGQDQMAPELARELLLTNPADVRLRAASARALGPNPPRAAHALSGLAADWRCLHLDVVERAEQARVDGGPLVMDKRDRRLAREFLESAGDWHRAGRPTVHPADAAAGAWLAERLDWAVEGEWMLPQDRALELFLTNPLDLVAPAAPVDPAAV